LNTGPAGGEPVGAGQIRHLARQSALLLSSGLVGYVGVFVLSIVLARSLGASEFGVWVVAWGIGQIMAVLGLLGADWILFRHGSHYHGTGDLPRLRATIRFSLTLCTIGLATLAVGMLLLAPTIADRFFDDLSLAPLFRVSGLIGLVIGIGQTLLYATQAFATVRDLAVVRNLLQPAVRLVAAVVAVVIAPTALSALFGMLAAEVLLTLAAATLLLRRISLRGPTKPIPRRELVRFGVPAWGSKMVETARGQLFPILLGALATFQGSAAYAASRRVVGAPNAVVGSFNQVYSPQASRLYLGKRHEELAVLFKSMGKWIFSLAFPVFCLTVAFPKEIVSVFGREFVAASSVLVVLSFAMLFNFSTGPVTATLIVAGRPRLALLDYVLVLGAEVGLALILIPRHGVLGAAVARLVGTAMNNLIPLAQVWWILRIHPYRSDYWKPVAAGLTAVVAALVVVHATGMPVGPPAAVVAAAIVGVVYLGMIVLLGLSPEDRSAVDALFRRSRVSRGAGPTDGEGGNEDMSEDVSEDMAIHPDGSDLAGP
jgi:O-antigen/teichoic acid export membrane protein